VVSTLPAVHPLILFAEKVEALCDVLLDQYQEEHSRDGSETIIKLENLKSEAADISSGKTTLNLAWDKIAEAL
jgi:hypothetical protein